METKQIIMLTVLILAAIIGSIHLIAILRGLERQDRDEALRAPTREPHPPEHH